MSELSLIERCQLAAQARADQQEIEDRDPWEQVSVAHLREFLESCGVDNCELTSERIDDEDAWVYMVMFGGIPFGMGYKYGQWSPCLIKRCQCGHKEATCTVCDLADIGSAMQLPGVLTPTTECSVCRKPKRRNIIVGVTNGNMDAEVERQEANGYLFKRAFPMSSPGSYWLHFESAEDHRD